MIGPHFYIRPLLPELVRDKTFYLLALSRKDVRMLRCTTRTSEEVALGAGTVANYDTWMNSVQARSQRSRQRQSRRRRAEHNKAGIIAPMGREDETKDDDLSHFFKQIDRGVNEALRGHTEPLVLAAVDYELPVYVAVNSYPHLAPEAVHGAPNSLKGGEMHARALDALTKWYDQKVDEAIARVEPSRWLGASSRLKDVVTAAHDGRVLTLLVSDSLESTGIFDEATNSVKARETGGPADEDLINDAAVQTILHAGKVLVTPNKKMPNGAPIGRYFPVSRRWRSGRRQSRALARSRAATAKARVNSAPKKKIWPE